MIVTKIRALAVSFASVLFVACQSGLVAKAAPQVRSTAAERTYDSVPPRIRRGLPSPTMLVFSKTSSFRHDAGIAGANRYFADLADDRGMGFFTTENSAVFNDKDLKRFSLIVFNNMNGDALSPAQEEAFKRWLEAGGAWIGLHAAGDNSLSDWTWYGEILIGPEFIGHPTRQYNFQDARLVGLQSDHAVLSGLPQSWMMRDEWYSYDDVPQSFGFTPLVGIDESSYNPIKHVKSVETSLSMGPNPIDHPLIWSACVGKGRALYSAIGHTQYVYDNKPYKALLANAVDWTMKLKVEVDCAEGR
ncbi:MAG: ThuA domain-containing protein [Litorimonas sp.]